MSERGAEWWKRTWVLAGLAISVVIVVVAAFLASGEPDGLERVAGDIGVGDRAVDNPFDFLPDYTIPGLDGAASTIVAGLVGVLIVLGIVLVLGRALVRRPPER